jgi:hypothetical protein
MKKTLISGILALASIPAFANCFVEMQYQGTRFGQNEFQAVSCRDAKRECMKTMKSLEREVMLVGRNSSEAFFMEGELACVTISGGSSGSGGNGHGSGNGHGYNLVTVVGSIENMPLNLSGMSVDEVYNQCLSRVKSYGLSRADDMVISVNGHKYVRKTTSGWWSSAESICNVVDSLMTNDRLLPVIPSMYPITIVGKVEKTKIEIVGALSEAEAYNRCVDTLNNKGVNKADDLIVSINGHKYVRKTTSGWWSTSVAICNVIDTLVPSRIQPVSATGLYSATGRIENINFNLSGNSIEEIFNKCVEFVQMKGISQADEVMTSINGARRQRYTTSGWWSTPIAICNQVIK